MSETIFTKVDYNLGGLVESIARGSIGLPDIQRPFVWPNAKIRDLFDSMYKGYPVGYLLFWENGLVPGHKAIGSDTKQLQPNLVIVDGQQRLTSLYAVMKGVSVLRSNYQSERIRIAFNPIDEVFEVTSAAIQRDRSFMPDISRLWSDETNLFQVVDQYLDGLRAVREISNDEIKSIQDAIAKLNALSSFPFTALQLSAGISEEDIGDVFVRINSQGKTLNQADFILTLMSVFWDDGRTALENFCRESRAPSTGAPSSYNHFIEPSPDQMLRVGVGLAFKRARLQHVYSILRGKDLESGEFSEERRDAQFEILKQAQAKVLNVQYWHDFMQCIRQAGYRTRRMISSNNALLYAYAFYLIGRTELHVQEHELRPAIAQWFFMSAITGRYSSSPESTLESDLAMLRDAATGEDFIQKLRHACNISLTTDFWEVTLPNELATSSARSPSLFAFEAALVLLDAPVLFSNFKVSEMLDPALHASHSAVERHHLFPRGYLSSKLGISQTRDTNQIANYTYVEWLDNLKISDQSPAEYVPYLEERFSPDELARMYRFHALPQNWEDLDYSEFLRLRRELMAQVIREGYERLIAGVEVSTEPDEVIPTDLIGGGESDSVEFKATLRINVHTGQRDRRMEDAVLKTLVGFLNTDGGQLFIGVSDEGTPLGIETDGFPDEDAMSLHLVNIVNRSMGANAWAVMHANFDDYEDHRVMVVRCEQSPTPVYLKDGNVERFYVRTGPATTELTGGQMLDYISNRFQQ
ncbi:MAG: DUF262 domain-containing protein [Dehalococcoidia bacterium]|nr:DUF262 domain-containing protein [Dehalococcoidia bacterium]